MRDKSLFFLISGFSFLVIIFIAVFAINESKQSQSSGSFVTYAASDKDKPQAYVPSLFTDIGSLSVNDEKRTDFAITNKGTKSLQLSQISASCDCTFGQLTIGGIKSPEFGMHSNSNWIGTVAPGGKATLTVIYRPYIMPVKGFITRYVYVTTNDPQNSRLTFTIRANVT